MSEELWYVKLANGDVHRVTLDQLDSAFQAGHIDENTMVLAEGLDTWSKLGEVAGLGDDEDVDVPVEQPAPAYHGAHGFDLSRTFDAPADLAPPPARSYAPPAAAYSAPPQAYAPATPYASTLPMHNSAGYIAQAAAAAQQQNAARRAAPVPSVVPQSYGSVSIAPAPSQVGSSLRPLAFDLEGDLDMPVRRKSRWGFVVAVIGLAGVAGGLGYVAQKTHFGQQADDISSVAAAAAMAPPPAPVTPPPPPVADPAPAPVPVAPSTLLATGATGATGAAGSTSSSAASTSESSPLNPAFTTRQNENTKVKLSAADKSKPKSRHGAAAGASHAAPKAKSPFTTGGNKFDPLNSAI